MGHKIDSSLQCVISTIEHFCFSFRSCQEIKKYQQLGYLKTQDTMPNQTSSDIRIYYAISIGREQPCHSSNKERG
jgi:hypothetical protein